jgi:hypothetical protein
MKTQTTLPLFGPFLAYDARSVKPMLIMLNQEEAEEEMTRQFRCVECVTRYATQGDGGPSGVTLIE